VDAPRAALKATPIALREGHNDLLSVHFDRSRARPSACVSRTPFTNRRQLV